jgi:hypothetical protein
VIKYSHLAAKSVQLAQARHPISYRFLTGLAASS